MSNETADIERETEQDAHEVEQETEQSEVETTEESGEPQATESDEGEVVISFGEESTTSDEAEEIKGPAPAWLKDLRKSDREKARRIRELEAKLAEKAQPQAEELGKEPELDDPDIDYDTAKFKQKWQAWSQQKQEHDAKVREQQAEVERQQQAWQSTLDNYGKAKAALKVDDFEDAEASAQEVLGATRAAIILSGADKPAELVYALGKSPAKLKQLASINDPVKFAFAVARLETQLKVTQRKAPPPAEKTVKGSSTAVGVADKTLERLEAEASRTGDRSKVVAYKRQLREQGK